jgi:hypothetical protein
VGALAIFTSPTDIFPNINIPVVSIIWGVGAQDVTLEQWQKLKALYAAAEDCAIEERSTFLSHVEAEDPELCAQLKLLRKSRSHG